MPKPISFAQKGQNWVHRGERVIKEDTWFQDGDTFRKLYCNSSPHPNEVASHLELQFYLHSQGDNIQ